MDTRAILFFVLSSPWPTTCRSPTPSSCRGRTSSGRRGRGRHARAHAEQEHRWLAVDSGEGRGESNAARRSIGRRLGEMKWEKAGIEEYGGRQERGKAAGGYRARLRRGEPRHLRGKHAARGDLGRTESAIEVRRDERGAKARRSQRLSGVPAERRTTGVVRGERHAGAAEHRGARRQCPAVW